MIIVDKKIKELVASRQLIIENYNEDNVGAVSYDITLDKIVADEELKNTYELVPGETIFVQSKEKISIPENMIGMVEEKNSRMRQGLFVSAPKYQPGHTTIMFLRVQNISNNIITLRSGMKIAQIMFEMLNEVPEKPYNNQQRAAFNDEMDYRGLGRYESEYQSDIRKYESAKEDLEKKESKLYANILTLMGIFISMFSLITINFGSITQSNFSAKYICIINVSLSLVITFMLGIILIFVNKAKNKVFLVSYCVLLVALIITFIGLCIWIF